MKPDKKESKQTWYNLKSPYNKKLQRISVKDSQIRGVSKKGAKNYARKAEDFRGNWQEGISG